MSFASDVYTSMCIVIKTRLKKHFQIQSKHTAVDHCGDDGRHQKADRMITRTETLDSFLIVLLFYVYEKYMDDCMDDIVRIHGCGMKSNRLSHKVVLTQECQGAEDTCHKRRMSF